MENRVKKILESVLDTNIDENTNAINCDSWDSMNQVDIILELQEEFGIKIPMDKAMYLNSYKAITEYIKSLK